LPASTQVDFYILEAARPGGRLNFACRLSEKAYSLGNAVYAHTASEQDARRLDELMWTFRQGSFVPHERQTSGESTAPVSIGTPEACRHEGEVLINLCNNVPEFATGFVRIAEIVDGTESGKAAGRQRFRQYREMGLEPETHTIR
jgi:DNA polymerase-3 subunit chi